MEIIIKGFDEEVTERLMKIMQDALDKGLEEVMFWSKLMSIKAEMIVEGNKIIIRKETD